MKKNAFSTVLLVLSIVISGCGSDKRDYEKAKEARTINAYEEFLRKHPDSKFLEQVRVSIDSLRYQQVVSKDSIAAYAEFIEKYPDSKFYSTVVERLEKLKFSIDGEWTGKTGQGKSITFTVLNGRITEFSVEGRFVEYGCSTTSSTSTTINQLIVDKSFSFSAPSGPGGISLNIYGTFASSTEAQGNAQMELHPIPGPPPGVPGYVPSCGGTVETTWKASKE